MIDSLVDKHRKQLTIADMGRGGKAHLTFALVLSLKHNRGIEVEMTGYELRPELVSLQSICAKLGYDKLNFVEANIEAIVMEKIDMVVSLHACDIATDMAIHAESTHADYIVLAPCCHKQIRKQIELRNGILNTASFGAPGRDRNRCHQALVFRG
ncbi:MAG: methyltransferase [Saprospiraceae bacterium]|nr:methyltransferase [Saprospiraceae bacterium]